MIEIIWEPMLNPSQTRQRKQLRLKGYDYSQCGSYYITICTQNRSCLFGDVRYGEIVLNDYGKIVQNEWCKTGEIRENIFVEDFIVMPNHIHGIIRVDDDATKGHMQCGNRGDGDVKNGHMQCAPTGNSFGGSVSNSISTIVKLFKSTTTRQIKQIRNASKSSIWQRGFYDHIIRDEDDLNRIREYIFTNPAKWEEDKYYNNS